MTELSIRPEEIRDALQKYVEDYKPSAASKEEVGTVAETADGIARITGLHHHAPVHERQAVADFPGKTDFVGHHDHGHAGLREVLHDIQDIAHELGVKG